MNKQLLPKPICGAERAALRKPRARTGLAVPATGPDREVEALLRSTLDGLSAHIAVLDGTGTIVAVNQAWRAFAGATGFAGDSYGVGMNYLNVCERGAHLSQDAARTAAALRDILAGRRQEFRMEYPCTGPDGPRWFQLRVTRPKLTQVQRIVVAHEDITEVKRAEAALARLSARLLQIQDEERRSIARELHDTTAQNLLAITLNLSRLREPLDAAGGSAHRILAETRGLAEQSLKEVRTLSYLLHPPLLDDIGLGSALHWFAKGFSDRCGIAVEVIVADMQDPLPREIATALFRVAQEALSNVHRHSGSTSARIQLIRQEASVELTIEDRGRGRGCDLDSEEIGPWVGVGISGMRIRIEQIGGQLRIRSNLCGTRVLASVPLRAESEAE